MGSCSSFSEVPAHLLADDRWQNLISDRWAYPESIQILEARALAKAAERMANYGPLVDCRALILGDNMAVALSFGRWRAREFKLIVQLRRVACLGLARGIKFYFRWHPSEFNNADAGSRAFDLHFDESKTLVHQLRSQPLVKPCILAQDVCPEASTITEQIRPSCDSRCSLKTLCGSKSASQSAGAGPTQRGESRVEGSSRSTGEHTTVESRLPSSLQCTDRAKVKTDDSERVVDGTVLSAPGGGSASTRLIRGCRGGQRRQQQGRRKYNAEGACGSKGTVCDRLGGQISRPDCSQPDLLRARERGGASLRQCVQQLGLFCDWRHTWREAEKKQRRSTWR